MQKRPTLALVALFVLFLSGCDFLGINGNCDCGGGGTLPPVEEEPYLMLFEGDSIPPHPVIPATDGTRHLHKAKDVFNYINLNGAEKPSEPGEARPETEVAVYRVTQDSKYSRMFGAAGKVDSLYFTEHQIIEFARMNQGWLASGNYSDLALVKIGDKVYVARLNHSVRLRNLNDPNIWVVEPFEVSGGPEPTAGNFVRIIVPK